MEQIITLKVDLEYPDEAHHAIDEAVKAYEADKLKWTAAELAEAKHLAMQIMTQLCLDGYNIDWCNAKKTYGFISITVWIRSEDDKKSGCTCMMIPDKWNTWIAKCICLCRATGRDVPAFIVKKAGECW
nr:MAG TPA: hypothetical protein [Caudoviricetes sp.]